MTTPLVRAYRGIAPRIADDVFLAENATVVGDVVLAEQANVWFGAVLRGDVGYVRVGARSNIQDLVMVHMTLERSNTVIGKRFRSATTSSCTARPSRTGPWSAWGPSCSTTA